MHVGPERLAPEETLISRRAYLALAAISALCFWLTTQVFFVPVTRGVDRNGYLLGGRMLAEGHPRGITPADPYIFLGPHWVMVKPGRFGLKYPLGLPVIYAILNRIAGADWSFVAHQVSPALMTLAVFGIYLLLRPIVGSYHSWLGMVVLCTSPITLFFANLPNSHAAAICAAVWGMLLLMKWWRDGSIWCAIAAGLIIGFDFTIRYTEGLLLLPMALVIIFAVRKNRSELKRATLMPIAWLLPVASLLIFNLITLHHLTGYGLTHESTAFSFASLWEHSRGMAGQIWSNVLGIFLIPTILGGLLMFRWNWRLAVVIWSWILPALLLYSSYYWMPADEPGLSYARFVLTVLPGLILMGLWLPRQLGNLSAAILGIIVAITAATNLPQAIYRAAGLHFDNLQTQVLLDAVESHIPTGSMIFTDQPNIPPLEVAGDWQLYLSNLFNRPYINTFAALDPNEPSILQAERGTQLYSLLGHLSDSELIAEQNKLMASAIREKRRVFIVLPEPAAIRFQRRFLDDQLWQIQTVDRWTIDTRWQDATSTTAPIQMDLAEIRPR